MIESYRLMLGPDLEVPEFQNERHKLLFLKLLDKKIKRSRRAIMRINLDERYKHCMILSIIGMMRLRHEIERQEMRK